MEFNALSEFCEGLSCRKNGLRGFVIAMRDQCLVHFEAGFRLKPNKNVECVSVLKVPVVQKV